MNADVEGHNIHFKLCVERTSLLSPPCHTGSREPLNPYTSVIRDISSLVYPETSEQNWVEYGR